MGRKSGDESGRPATQLSWTGEAEKVAAFHTTGHGACTSQTQHGYNMAITRVEEQHNVGVAIIAVCQFVGPETGGSVQRMCGDGQVQAGLAGAGFWRGAR
ncbi:hypothetical protein BaRGS_00009980 [Batillaria attramentaria]|uniref:Uncharacterized protein n=1 Tax=Batillaria attramentaria TaxID=370345 RepID=A0ABD0LIF2_9CAEN